MLYNLQQEKIVLEIKELVNTVENTKNEVNIYCDLMKQLFLSTSKEN